MWVVAKCNLAEFEVFKKELIKKIGKDIVYYHPKIIFSTFYKKKKKVNYILGDYIFCKNDKFKNINFLNSLNYTRGLKYFLYESFSSQNEIKNFINFCKCNEDANGFLRRGFFKFSIIKKYKFISGPLKNFLFNIISNNKKKIDILLNGKKISVLGDNNNFLAAE
tara:strand:- start:25335 stop:25829 length:495 start_codon:yes stop_codon:yes gene_type:complete